MNEEPVKAHPCSELSSKYAGIADVRLRRLAFLEDIKEFYTSKNRAVTKLRCVYHPTEFSPGCAVGRCLDRDSSVILEKHRGSVSKIEHLLPKWMAEMGTAFLVECQMLHDESMFWDETGLSSNGLERYYEIKRHANRSV